MFSSRFMLFPTLKKKFGVKKIIPGEGGVEKYFFLEKQFFLISRLCYFQHYKKIYWKVPLHLLVKWEVGGRGGVMFFSHFMLFPTFLENKIWEYKTIISHLMFSSCFFMLEILKSDPSLTVTG